MSSSSGVLLKGAIYGSIIGSILTASISSLIVQAGSSDGVFGTYFQNIVDSTCPDADGIIVGSSKVPETYGKKVCKSFKTMLKDAGIYITDTGNVGVGKSPSQKLDVSGNMSVDGVVKVGTVTPTCNGSLAGSLRFDSSYRTFEGCDGVRWRGLKYFAYSWSTGDWGSCSKACGGGVQTRSLTCQREDGVMGVDSNCTGTKPNVSQSCNTQSCYSSLNETIWNGNGVGSKAGIYKLESTKSYVIGPGLSYKITNLVFAYSCDDDAFAYSVTVNGSIVATRSCSNKSNPGTIYTNTTGIDQTITVTHTVVPYGNGTDVEYLSIHVN